MDLVAPETSSCYDQRFLEGFFVLLWFEVESYLKDGGFVVEQIGTVVHSDQDLGDNNISQMSYCDVELLKLVYLLLL